MALPAWPVCSMTKREQAIAIIEECREIHANWARAMRDPNWGAKQMTRAKAGGGGAWHRKWVKHYDLVLEVLRGRPAGR